MRPETAVARLGGRGVPRRARQLRHTQTSWLESALVVPYPGTDCSHNADEPLHTVPTRDRFGVAFRISTMHGLGHTGNTLAAETSATLCELLNRMGHRSPRAALIYLHARDHRDHEIATGLDRIVAEARDQAEGHERRWSPLP